MSIGIRVTASCTVAIRTANSNYGQLIGNRRYRMPFLCRPSLPICRCSFPSREQTTRCVFRLPAEPGYRVARSDKKKSPSEVDWTPVIRTPGQDIAPSFSPDGEKIAFRSDVTGRLQIWVSSTDGSNAAPIDTGSPLPSVTGWTPDSQSIVFCSPLRVFTRFLSLINSHFA